MKMPFLAHNNVYQLQEEIKKRMQTKYEKKTCRRTFERSNHHAIKDLARETFKGRKHMHDKRFDFV